MLSVIVVNFNFERELPRTLFTLSTRYQQHVSTDDYEVLVVDSASTRPPSAEAIASFGGNFRLLHAKDPQPSPARAINGAAAAARGDLLAVMIDGARIVSPGMVRYTLDAARLAPRPVIISPNWHLGHEVQFRAAAAGYDQDVEDRLLATVPWRSDGYELYRIATPGTSAAAGVFKTPGESNFLGMSRALFTELGGYDEGFDLPGGGLVNKDMLARAVAAPDTRLFLLLGEATFHQYHGGAVSGAHGDSHAAALAECEAQYTRLRGKASSRPSRAPEFIGHLPPQLRDAAGLSSEARGAAPPPFMRRAWAALRRAR